MSVVEQVVSERARFGPGAALGIDEALIHAVVHGFYGRIRRDAMLKDIFDRIIGDGWDAHLAKMCDFWSSVLLMTGRFKGTPMAVHVGIDEIGPAHFDHWLELFRETVAELCPGDRAALFNMKAEMIAQSLQYGIAVSRGEMPSRAVLR